MKIIKQSVEIWEQGYDLSSIYAHIARCARVCYQSEKTNPDETEVDWVNRVILRHSPAKNPKNHLSVLEHGAVYLTVPKTTYNSEIVERYENNPYSKVLNPNVTGNSFCITTNFRVIIENGWEHDLRFLDINPIIHSKRITVSFITDIGVSRELNRHRSHSISEESTRYCNYKDDIYFIEPAWGKQTGFVLECGKAEDCYKWYIENNYTPQIARQSLTLSTKTQVVHTAFKDDWYKFLELRADEISGKVHPNMLQLAQMLKEKMNL